MGGTSLLGSWDDHTMDAALKFAASRSQRPNTATSVLGGQNHCLNFRAVYDVSSTRRRHIKLPHRCRPRFRDLEVTAASYIAKVVSKGIFAFSVL